MLSTYSCFDGASVHRHLHKVRTYFGKLFIISVCVCGQQLKLIDAQRPIRTTISQFISSFMWEFFFLSSPFHLIFMMLRKDFWYNSIDNTPYPKLFLHIKTIFRNAKKREENWAELITKGSTRVNCITIGCQMQSYFHVTMWRNITLDKKENQNRLLIQFSMSSSISIFFLWFPFNGVSVIHLFH